MALSTGTFQNIGGAVSDLFSASAFRTKGQGLRTEAEEFLSARDLAFQNEAFTKNSTEIQEQQTNRAIEKTLGGQAAQVAASGYQLQSEAANMAATAADKAAQEQQQLPISREPRRSPGYSSDR